MKKRLAFIAAGYALSVVGGLAAAALNELRMSEDIAQTSSGMVAFADVVLFLVVAGFLGLVPTWFLLKLAVEKVPRALLLIEGLIAALGPVSWLATVYLAGEPGPANPLQGSQLLGLFIAFVAIPRMILGPVLLVVEAATFLMIRGRLARVFLVAAMLMDIIPLTMFAVHMARAVHY